MSSAVVWHIEVNRNNSKASNVSRLCTREDFEYVNCTEIIKNVEAIEKLKIKDALSTLK